MLAYGPALATSAPALDPAYETATVLLRINGVVAFFAYVLGVLVMPGSRGRLGQSGVEWVERATSVATLAAYVLSAFALAHAAVAVFRRPKFPLLTSFTILVATFASMLVAPGLMRSLSFPFAMGASAATVIALGMAASRTLKAPPTRAAGVVMVGVALVGALRALAFVMARSTLDAAPRSDGLARALGSTSVVLGVVLLLFVHLWLAARGGNIGRIASNVGLLGAVAVCVAMSSRSAAGTFAMLKHSLLAYEMPPLSSPVLVVSSWRLVLTTGTALACLLPWRRSALILPPLAMLVLGSASFDMPVANLLTNAALVWLCLAAEEPRLLWIEAKAIGAAAKTR